jgi:hypothetical protein
MCGYQCFFEITCNLCLSVSVLVSFCACQLLCLSVSVLVSFCGGCTEHRKLMAMWGLYRAPSTKKQDPKNTCGVCTEHRVPKNKTKKHTNTNTNTMHRAPSTEKQDQKTQTHLNVFLSSQAMWGCTEHRVLENKTKKHKHISEREAKSQQIAEQSLLSCLQCFLSTKSSA